MKFLEYLKVEMKFNFQMLSRKEKTFLLGVKLNNSCNRGKECKVHIVVNVSWQILHTIPLPTSSQKLGKCGSLVKLQGKFFGPS